jgi:hypothetical protein
MLALLLTQNHIVIQKGASLMSTNAEISARLLRHAAEFFRHVGEQNPNLQEQLSEEARVFDTVADVVEKDPTGASLDNSANEEENS